MWPTGVSALPEISGIVRVEISASRIGTPTLRTGVENRCFACFYETISYPLSIVLIVSPGLAYHIPLSTYRYFLSYYVNRKTFRVVCLVEIHSGNMFMSSIAI